MRYDTRMGRIGDAASGGFFGNEGLKQQAIANAPNMTDGQAQDLLEISDATKLGNRTKWTRYGIGAVVGFVVGAVVMSKMKKKG